MNCESVRADTFAELEVGIMERVENGCRPHGGLAWSQGLLTQALVGPHIAVEQREGLMEYQIVTADTGEKLGQLIGGMESEGWQLLGDAVEANGTMGRAAIKLVAENDRYFYAKMGE